MKVKLEVSPDAKITCEKDKDGNVISVTFEPMFAKRQGQAVLAYGTAETDAGKRIEEFALYVSGSTGKTTKTSRNEPVTAAVDQPDPKPAPKPAATKGPHNP